MSKKKYYKKQKEEPKTKEQLKNEFDFWVYCFLYYLCTGSMVFVVFKKMDWLKYILP